MIPSEIMDKIIRVPDEEEETEAKIEELKEAGFVITNFSKGGVFYILPVLDIEWHRFMKDPKRSAREAKNFCREINRFI